MGLTEISLQMQAVSAGRPLTPRDGAILVELGTVVAVALRETLNATLPGFDAVPQVLEAAVPGDSMQESRDR